ncbi:hypothetical protein [Streptomyces acidiscabies]|uniref:Uncharacterized protein n=1 Tax=Streptomyces acidiscabies TaxID=42234 RepID=A0AAP6EL30_9ACTN|nr:hypothetical protein [Streptomyces acidiscabies]MBZ3909389.1 hypothetical protein [Streptomyces acidiscabies]MDX2966618.1 hypothetical protein [Streptomyces acidiscabies]MDX3796588.1 hypothetical protein [Streptomyces acidiscabies]
MSDSILVRISLVDRDDRIGQQEQQVLVQVQVPGVARVGWRLPIRMHASLVLSPWEDALRDVFLYSDRRFLPEPDAQVRAARERVRGWLAEPENKVAMHAAWVSDRILRDPITRRLHEQVIVRDAEIQQLRAEVGSEHLAYERLRVALESPRRDRRVLRARVAELEGTLRQIRYLHTDSPMGPCPVCIDADALGRGKDYTVPWPCPTAQLTGAEEFVPDGITRRLAPTQTLQPEPEAPALIIHRAQWDSMPLGLYSTPDAARAHCEDHARRDLPTAAAIDWVTDPEDGVAELHATVDGEQGPTGYTVVPLEVTSEYDEEADE